VAIVGGEDGAAVETLQFIDEGVVMILVEERGTGGGRVSGGGSVVEGVDGVVISAILGR